MIAKRIRAMEVESELKPAASMRSERLETWDNNYWLLVSLFRLANPPRVSRVTANSSVTDTWAWDPTYEREKGMKLIHPNLDWATIIKRYSRRYSSDLSLVLGSRYSVESVESIERGTHKPSRPLTWDAVTFPPKLVLFNQWSKLNLSERETNGLAH